MKKKITAVALAVCILVVGIVGATMSYFTDKDTATNTFTFGEGVDIKLTESSIAWNDGKADSTTYSEFNLYGATNGTGLENYLTGGLTYDNVIPGRHYSKAPHVELVNSGKSDPAWIVVTATYPEGRPFNLGGQATVVDIEGRSDDANLLIEKIGNTYYYYFQTKVQPGSVVTPFTWMQLDPSVNNADTNKDSAPFNVEVKAYAVLAAGFDDCKTAFKAAFADVVGDASEPVTAEVEAAAGVATVFEVEAAPAGGDAKTTVEFEANALTDGDEYTLTATTYGMDSAAANFKVVSDGEPVAAIDLNLTKGGVKADFDGTATITTSITKGLSNVEVIYDGTGKQPTNVTYDPATGALTFKTTHFSTYIVTADAVSAMIGDVAYETLADAIAAAKDGETVVLTKDAIGAGLSTKDGAKKMESLVIDLNGHTYTMKNPAVGSTGTETQAMHWGTSVGAVTLKNGSFKVADDAVNVKMAMQNYVTFTAENVDFDFSAITVQNYPEYTGAYAAYSGLEIPMFNNNNDGTSMTLKGCTLKMPADSTMGVYTEGNLVMTDTSVDGGVAIADNGTVTVNGKFEATKGIVSYFSGFDPKESENVWTVVPAAE